MIEERKKILTELEEKLGYYFRNLSLLNQAVTHKSYTNENPSEKMKDNERMEFFGDAVLSLIISDYFFHKFPDSNEGRLSKMRSGIVSENNLTRISRTMEIGNYLQLGKGEEITGGRDKSSLLTNAFEAIIGAIYIDSGYEKTYSTIIYLFKDMVEGIEKSEICRDFKSELQEFVQNKKSTIPKYRLANEYGPDHEKIFEIEILIGDEVYGKSKGRNKKLAEQSVAREVLILLKEQEEERKKREAAQNSDALENE